MGGLFGGGGKSSPPPPPPAPPAAPAAPTIRADVQARQKQDMRRSAGRAANVLAGETMGEAKTGSKTLLGS
jgi:hypothetical protein